MSKANRGRAFEEAILQALALEKGAVIIKVPTPWQVIRKYNPRIKKSEIVSAFPAEKSIVDFIGLYKGRALAFDAKSTENKTSFPLSNIEPHQVAFLEKWAAGGGFSFFLVHFTALQRTFFLPLAQLRQFQQEYTRKSIPLAYFEQATKEIGRLLYFLQELSRDNIL